MSVKKVCASAFAAAVVVIGLVQSANAAGGDATDSALFQRGIR